MRGRKIPEGFFTYLVGWDADLIIKAGVTMSRYRFGSFVTRGATLYQLDKAPIATGMGCHLEAKLDNYLRANLPQAFAVKSDATAFLGNRGAGYLECYRAPDEASYADALSTCSSIMLEHPGTHGRLLMPPHMHGRTDVQTYLEPHSPNATNPKFSNVRACTANEGNGVGE